MEGPVSQIIIVIILTAINAFFAATEMAIVSVNRNKIKILAEDGNKKAKALLKLLEEPTKFLSTIQVAITLSGFFQSGTAATGLAPYIGGYLSKLGIPSAATVAFFLITILLSYTTLVFGELVPKRFAMQRSEKIALGCIGPVAVIAKIALPFVKLLSFSTNLVLHLLGVKTEGIEEQVSKEEIRSLVEVGEETGVFNETEKDMINSIFLFDDKLAKEVMTPRTEVFAVDASLPIASYVEEMLRNMYSRIPVYENDIDNVIGILYMKDFMAEAYRVGFDEVDIRKIIQQPYFVPERKNIDVLFKELQESKKHIAILVDEYGGFSGIVTIEDLIEEILGEIEDEFDNEAPDIIKLEDNVYEIKGILHINDLNEELSLDFDAGSEEYDTVSGLIIDLLGHIPELGQEDVAYENYIFHISEVKENRIEKVIMTILPKALVDQDDE